MYIYTYITFIYIYICTGYVLYKIFIYNVCQSLVIEYETYCIYDSVRIIWMQHVYSFWKGKSYWIKYQWSLSICKMARGYHILRSHQNSRWKAELSIQHWFVLCPLKVWFLRRWGKPKENQPIGAWSSMIYQDHPSFFLRNIIIWIILRAHFFHVPQYTFFLTKLSG